MATMYRIIAFLFAAMAAGCTPEAQSPQPNAAETPVMKDAAPADAKLPAQAVSLEIGGMHCDGCVETVQGILEKLDGVESAAVSLETNSATVRMKPGKEFPEAAARDKLDIDDYKLKAAPRVIATK